MPSEAPSANPSQGCENVSTDCGWGLFNPWTCRCDCPAGICLDNNEQCYTPCQETINVNPFAGCTSGWDCPWFPDSDAGHCLSEMHQPNKFEIYRTASECCKEHYGGSAICLTKSKASHDPFAWPIHFPGTDEYRANRQSDPEELWGTDASNIGRWFPDQINELNCKWGNNYENWMTEDGFAPYYLFSNSEDCCEKWYPSLGSGCPAAGLAVNPEAQDESHHNGASPMSNYYFPDFATNNCAFGWDYPSWYGDSGYEKFYLFRTGELCCSRYFPGQGGCPYENESNMQSGYYWETYQENLPNGVDMPIRYNHTYYPDISADTCVNGTDYPPYMASDKDYRRNYLFKNLEGCCTHWFTTSGLEKCKANMIQSIYIVEPCPLNRAGCTPTASITNMTEHRLTMWYPDLDSLKCKNDGSPEFWMLDEEFVEWYLFNTKDACCAGFGYSC